MRVALCTMMDDNFVIGFEAFFKSFSFNNPWFKDSGIEFVVIDVGLSSTSKEIIKSYYSNTVFKKPLYENYKSCDMSKTIDKLKRTYYTIDVFSYTQYDRIVFMDMDMIVIRDIENLFSVSYDIAGCHTYSYRMDELTGGINAGVFVLNQGVLNEMIYRALLKKIRKGSNMPEQKAMNRYFRDRLQYLDKTFNVEKRMLHTLKYKTIMDKAKVIHYVAKKPWESLEGFPEIEGTYKPLEDLWYRWSVQPWKG